LVGSAQPVFDWPASAAAVGGGSIVLAGPEQTFSVVSITDGRILFKRDTEFRVETVAISPNGRYAAAALASGGVHVVNATKGADARRPIVSRGVKQLAFSPDSAYLAVVARDNVVRVYTYSTESVVESLAHRGTVSSLAWSKSADNYRIVTGATDGARLWTITRNLPQEIRLPDTNASTAVAFSPDSGLVATAGQDGVRVWNVLLRSLMASMSPQIPVVSVAFDPEAEHLAGGGANQVRIWQVASRREFSGLALDGTVKTVAYSRDGRLLAATTSTGQVSVFSTQVPTIPTDGEGLARLACLQTERNLTQQEWEAAFPNEPIRETCPAEMLPKELTNPP
jgi:WD40 repeat protein